MFSDDVLERIFAIKELQKLDLQTQSAIIHAIEEALEQEGRIDDSISDQHGVF